MPLPDVPILGTRSHRSLNGWNDLTASINAAKVTGASQPTWAVYAGGIYAYSFSPTTMNECWPDPFHILHDISELSHLWGHAHFSTLGTNTGTVRFGLEWMYAKGHGQEPFSTPVTYYWEQAVSATPKMHQVVEGTEVGTDVIDGPATGIETDGLLICRFFRDAAHVNDTCTDPVFVHTVDIHYYCDHYATAGRAPNFNVPAGDFPV